MGWFGVCCLRISHIVNDLLSSGRDAWILLGDRAESKRRIRILKV